MNLKFEQEAIVVYDTVKKVFWFGCCLNVCFCFFLEAPAGDAAWVLMYICDNQDNKSALNWQSDFWVEAPPKKVPGPSQNQ